MARAATLRNVAANIDEIILFTTFEANIRWLCGGYKKSALGAFPIGQTTIGTNISHEPAVDCVATKSTYICFRFVFHFFHLSYIDLSACMEFSIFDRFHDVFAEHQVFDIALRYHNPLAAGKADFPAAIVEAFDLLIDTANGLYFSLLVDGAGNRDILSQGYTGKAGKQGIDFSGRSAVPVHTAAGLLECNAGTHAQRFVPGILFSQIAA
jgi:hypothetical protein